MSFSSTPQYPPPFPHPEVRLQTLHQTMNRTHPYFFTKNISETDECRNSTVVQGKKQQAYGSWWFRSLMNLAGNRNVLSLCNNCLKFGLGPVSSRASLQGSILLVRNRWIILFIMIKVWIVLVVWLLLWMAGVSLMMWLRCCWIDFVGVFEHFPSLSCYFEHFLYLFCYFTVH